MRIGGAHPGTILRLAPHVHVLDLSLQAGCAPPVPGRASEGSLRFNVDYSPMASPAFEGGRPGEAAVETTRLLERAFRNAGAVDLEALCVVAGVKARPGSCGAKDIGADVTLTSLSARSPGQAPWLQNVAPEEEQSSAIQSRMRDCKSQWSAL